MNDPAELTKIIQHDDDITAIAVDPSGTVCATGQLGMNPRIIIWDIATMEVHSIIGSGYHHSGFFQRAVAAIAFLGDSFVEGVSLNYEKTFVGIFEAKKNKDRPKGLSKTNKSLGGYRCAER